MPIKYQMSKELFNIIRYPIVWDKKSKKNMKATNPLSTNEVIDYVNATLGLRGTVTEISVI